MLVLALLAACSLSEDAFPDAFGRAACSRMERCDRSAYEDLWTDRQECVDAWADLAELYLDAGDLLGASYDPQAGRDCVREVRYADCGDVDNGDIDCDLWE